MAINLKSVMVDRTMLFPCAAGVQMPQIGAEDSKIKPVPGSKISKLLPMKLVSQDTAPVKDRYVKMVSTGLSFAEEVVEDRCMDMLPYDTKYFKGVFKPGELVTLPPRATSSIGRHDKRGTDVRHMPCYLKKTIKPKQLVPLRKQAKEKALLLHKQALEAQQQEETKRKLRDSEEDRGSFFMTQPYVTESKSRHSSHKTGSQVLASKTETKNISSAKVGAADKDISVSNKGNLALSESGEKIGDEKAAKETIAVDSKTPEYDWDDHLMSRLSKLTANWIVHQKMDVGERSKEKLTKTLESWYGAPIHTDLVREETSDEDEEDTKKKEKKPKSKWKKKEAALLERVYNVTPPPVEALDPYSDDSKAPFYRQPAGIRKKKKNEEKEEAVLSSSMIRDSNEDQRAINATAHNIEMKRRPDTPPLTVRDYLPPGVGDKVYHTDNRFQQEWLTGNNQIFHHDDGLIKMDSKNKFRKNLQREMPQQPKMWYDLGSDDNQETKDGKMSFKPHKGHKRWIGLPETVEDNLGMVKDMTPGFDPVYLKEPDPKQKRKIKQNKILGAIVHDWRNKWFLNGQFADATPDDLIRDMADIQPHVRLKAVGTVAKVRMASEMTPGGKKKIKFNGQAAEYKPPTDSSIALDSSVHDPINDLPEQIFVALECLLDDNNDQVQKAAAITLYSLDRPSDKAKVRLRDMLNVDNTMDRWAAAQCLAHYGECDSDVVAEIIKQILDSESAIKHEQGMALLAKISNSSTLVHCMVAEQLNSSSWRYRVIACKILPTLFGSINRDITQKLSELMWHDWHVEVRKAAAQCLGKTSHGRDVHDDIRDRILHGTERTKMEAINKLGQLGIMTAKLLPAFLDCFTDSYVSIRCEVCITCGNLQIKEEQVLERLVHLATFDPIWKVKALAIQALGKIGEVNEDVKECLLWAMRYEERPGVRAEACHSLVGLDIDDEDVIEIVQDRLLVESNQLVREEMIEALSVFGYSTSEDMDTVAQIKAEVRKLCTRNIIASQIIVNENDDTKREQLKRKVLQTEKDIETLNERKQVILRRIRSQARSSRASNKDSLSSSPPPRTSTPIMLPTVKIGGSPQSSATTPEPVSREGTVFTPTADKELEAILNQDEDELESLTESTSGGGKSRPVTEGSMGGGGELSGGGAPETPGDKENDDGMNSLGQVVSKITITKADDENDDDADGEGEDEEEEKDTTTRLDTGKSSGHQQNNVQLSLPRSQAGLLSPMGSAAGDLQRSRLTVMSRISGKRSIISRDSLREREKMNAEVNTIYADLNARYANMIQHLVKIDKGLNTKGSSAESSTVESLNVSNVGSSHIARLSHQEIIDTIKELEYIQSARQEKGAEVNLNLGDENDDDVNVDHGEGEQFQQSGEGIMEGAAETTGEETREDGDEFDDEDEDRTYAVHDQDAEWKSFVDTLSQDNTEDNDDNDTTYPFVEDNTAGVSMLTTTDENTARDDDEDDGDDDTD